MRHVLAVASSGGSTGVPSTAGVGVRSIAEDAPCTPEPEVCGDGIDQDCDETPDDWDPTAAPASRANRSASARSPCPATIRARRRTTCSVRRRTRAGSRRTTRRGQPGVRRRGRGRVLRVHARRRAGRVSRHARLGTRHRAGAAPGRLRGRTFALRGRRLQRHVEPVRRRARPRPLPGRGQGQAIEACTPITTVATATRWVPRRMRMGRRA